MEKLFVPSDRFVRLRDKANPGYWVIFDVVKKCTLPYSFVTTDFADRVIRTLSICSDGSVTPPSKHPLPTPAVL